MAYLINDRYLTENTSVGTNTNEKSMAIALQSVTVINVKPLLGTPLYELFENHINGGVILNAKQTELFKKVQYFMGLRVEREMLYNLLNISNKGVTQDEHVANMDVVNTKRQDIEAKADFCRRDILKYLEANKPDFPEFYPEPTTTAPTSNPVYSSGIVFDYEPRKYFM